PGLEHSPRLAMVAVGILVVGGLVLLIYAVPPLLEDRDAGMGGLGIRADQQYFSPHLSTTKGLRLELTNTTATKFLENTYTWSADYGFFIRVVPSTSDVTILGNPVPDNNFRDIYWTYAEKNTGTTSRPVTIEVRRSSHQGMEQERAVLYLDWFTDDIVKVNNSPIRVSL
ncbi:MAG TPA: hypothetical protein VLL74_08205, partial [Methanoregula sp.]|nr:hypothetical protein [Methanoregula sp.]